MVYPVMISRLEPYREVLDNGVVLLYNRSRDTPSVALRGSLPAGSAREPEDKAGLASFVGRILRRGTTHRFSQEISAVVEDIGASFATWGGTEEAGFSAKCLGRDLATVLDLLQEVLEQPAFPETEVERTRAEVLTVLREHEESTRARADLAILRMLYPEGHPYSRPSIGNRETVEALGLEDFREFHDVFYAAPGMIVTIAGDVDLDLVRGRLAGWFKEKPTPPPLSSWTVEPNGDAGRVVIPMPHKSQVDLIMAGPGVPRHHPDFLPLTMVNLILGSLGLMGRLGEQIREQQGMAYYVSSRSTSRLWAGEWTANAGVAPENVDRTLEAILEQVRIIRRELVSETEMTDATDYLIGSLPLRLETNDGIASYLLNTEYYRLGIDYIDRYPGQVRAQTRERLRQAAQDHMDPDRFSIAMAGPLPP